MYTYEQLFIFTVVFEIPPNKKTKSLTPLKNVKKLFAIAISVGKQRFCTNFIP